MRIGIIGGTGSEGSGLAMRFARAGHAVTIGSRSAERGAQRAGELSERCGSTIAGSDNAGSCAGAELVILSIPYSGHGATIADLKPALAGKIVVDITVPLKPPKVRSVNLPDGQAAALEAQAILGEDAVVVGALHHVSSTHLADLDHDIPTDVLVVCNKRDVRETVIDLLTGIGCRALDAGVLRNAIALESLTPLLIHMNKRYKSEGTGIRITGIPGE